MPGISFLCDGSADLRTASEKISLALDSMLYTNKFTRTVYSDEQGFFLATTGYAEYPFQVYETASACIHVEGRIYDEAPTAAAKQVAQIVDMLFTSSDPQMADLALSEWLLQTEGEFVVVAREKVTGRTILFNDALGRLPIYSCQRGSRLAVSRELRFFTKLLDELPFDRMAIAQSLLFG